MLFMVWFYECYSATYSTDLIKDTIHSFEPKRIRSLSNHTRRRWHCGEARGPRITAGGGVIAREVFKDGAFFYL